LDLDNELKSLEKELEDKAATHEQVVVALKDVGRTLSSLA